MMQPCWTCKKYAGGCNWSGRDPETGQLRFEPVEGWIAAHRIYGQTGYGVKPMESWEILYCPEYVSDGTRAGSPDTRAAQLRERGLSFDRIGQMVGLTAREVRSRLRRAKEGGK